MIKKLRDLLIVIVCLAPILGQGKLDFSEKEKKQTMCYDQRATGYPLAPPFTITANFKSKEYFAAIGHYHLGIDLVKYHQAPVYAVEDGEIILVDDRGFDGNGYINGKVDFSAPAKIVTLRYKHNDNGYIHAYYLHLSKIFVHEKEQVKKGTVLGLQGNSGPSTGSHLHFETRRELLPFVTQNLGRDTEDLIDPNTLFDFKHQEVQPGKKLEKKCVSH